MTALEQEGKLENTVIIGITDHYTYGYKDEASLMALSGVGEKLLLEKTPCFIWSADLEPMEVSKTLNTADFLPTVLNLLGVETGYRYLGRDAFDETYPGQVLFSDGSWITAEAVYDAGKKKYMTPAGEEQLVTETFAQEMKQTLQAFVSTNNLILETDYYGQ